MRDQGELENRHEKWSGGGQKGRAELLVSMLEPFTQLPQSILSAHSTQFLTIFCVRIWLCLTQELLHGPFM